MLSIHKPQEEPKMVQETYEMPDLAPKQRESTEVIEKIDLEPVTEEPEIPVERMERDVYIVNYHPNDSTGSGRTTASGYTIYDFETSPEGFYRFNGLLVGAIPVGEVLYLEDTGEVYYLYEGYKYYKLGDTLHIEFEYQGTFYSEEMVLLDVCGACYGMAHESKQRIDLFTAYPTVGKRDAKEITYE